MSQQVYLPSYSIGEDVYKRVPQICSNYGKTAIVIGGEISLSKVKDKLLTAMKGTDINLLDFIWYGGNATRENIERLKNIKTVQMADMIFAVGGGKSMDTCKALADMLKKPVFTFPTIASNCAPVTALCILYGKDKVEFYDAQKPAIHCFIDTKIISNAPIKYLRAGIGDALSKQYEVCFNTRGRVLNHTNNLGVQIAKDCSERLLKYGVKAVDDAQKNIVSDEFIQTVLTIIVNTGLVSVLVNLNYNSSLAHSLYLASVKIPDCKNHMHGEIVSLGVLLLLLVDKQLIQAEKVYDFNQKLDLPTSLMDLGIKDVKQIIDLILQDKYLSFAPYNITKEMIKEAIDMLKALKHKKTF